jgi:DNA invertase Pin-like site-specific DNA recombinase
MGEVKYLAGLYLRLSKDDERAGESVSIENQRLLLRKYADDKGIDIYQEYIDDGWSGTTLNRPAFQRMLRDAEDKVINMIIVKDLSRAGRNYIEVGRLTEETLPRLGCRFVALNDSVDSIMGENDMMVYRNLFNEFLSKDTSKKVRAVKQACMRQGKFMGSVAPLGYKKDPLNKHHLIIDEETAPIVHRIFALRCQSMGHFAITGMLNAERVPSPRAIYYRRAGRENPNRDNGLWNKMSVGMVLSNECYIGNLVQGKRGTISYKNHRLVAKDEEQWVRVENTHEPLVSREDWDTVRALDNPQFKPRKDSDGKINLFSGILKCADCGFNLRTHLSCKPRKAGGECRKMSYICGNYARSGKAACTAHMISESVLCELVLTEIRAHASLIEFDEQRVVNTILNSKSRESRSLETLHRQELKLSEGRMAELDNIIRMLYQDRVNGHITEVMFKNMMTNYEREREAKENAVSELRAKIGVCDQDACNVSAWIKAIRKYAGLEKLTRAVLMELIDRIEVFQSEKIGKRRICRIHVHYKFVGMVGDTLNGANELKSLEGGGESLEQAI